MKIIANTKDGWLLEANNDEIATLQGLSRVDKRFKSPKPGDEFSITEVYSILASISYDNDIKELESASKSLGKLGDWLKTYKAKHKEKAKDLQYQSDRN